MDQKQILDVVVKHLRENVEHLEDREIDPSRSMADYGATSLDIVEVVTAAMREIGLRVPRTELAGIENINELVALFARLKNQTP